MTKLHRMETHIDVWLMDPDRNDWQVFVCSQHLYESKAVCVDVYCLNLQCKTQLIDLISNDFDEFLLLHLYFEIWYHARSVHTLPFHQISPWNEHMCQCLVDSIVVHCIGSVQKNASRVKYRCSDDAQMAGHKDLRGNDKGTGGMEADTVRIYNHMHIPDDMQVDVHTQAQIQQNYGLHLEGTNIFLGVDVLHRDDLMKEAPMVLLRKLNVMYHKQLDFAAEGRYDHKRPQLVQLHHHMDRQEEEIFWLSRRN